MLCNDLLLDHALANVIGVKQFFKLYKKIYVYECKQAGLSQNQTLIKLNKELTNQGQPVITLSLVKYLWH
jgi:hypothetical protein